VLGRHWCRRAGGPLSRYCNHLDLLPEVQAICEDTIVAVREHGIADRRSSVLNTFWVSVAGRVQGCQGQQHGRGRHLIRFL
jgi:hypothetical protein